MHGITGTIIFCRIKNEFSEMPTLKIISVSSFKKYSPSWFENSKYFSDVIAYYQAWWPWDRTCSRFCSRLGNNCYRDPILYEPRIISKYPIWKRIGCMGPWMLHIWNDDKETCIQRQVITYHVIITSSLRIRFSKNSDLEILTHWQQKYSVASHQKCQTTIPEN